jgi:hypothetical protein
MTPAKDKNEKPAARARKAASSTRAKPPSKNAPNEPAPGEVDDQDLPGDAAGRLKIKRQYEELLGIRIEKLKGRVLNREKINKTIEGIYYICLECKRICHNLDEGLVQDPATQFCYCETCRKKK